MSSVYNFVRRHRRKLLWGGAAVGGLMIAARLMERQMTQARDKTSQDALERVRKSNHYETTERTCNSTIIHLYLELRSKILETFNTDKLTDTLRSGPPADEKIRIWNEIKILCFCKLAASVIAQAFLGVLVRLQLNILAGYLFTERVSVSSLVNNNSVSRLSPSSSVVMPGGGVPRKSIFRDPDTSRFSKRVQEKYLNIAQYFIDEGFRDVCEGLLVNVTNVLRDIPLQEKLKLSDLEQIFQRLMDGACTEFPERNLFLNPGKFLLSSSESSSSLARELTELELESLKNMLSETLEIMESQEVNGLLRRICRQGFAFLVDNMADHYSTVAQNVEGVDEFVSPCDIGIPMAKLVPILSSLVMDDSVGDDREEDEWLVHIREHGDLKLLGANCYETFCEREREREAEANHSWLQYLSTSVSSFF